VPVSCDDTQRRSEVLLIAKSVCHFWDELKLWWDKINRENQRTRRQTWRSTTSSTTNVTWGDKGLKLDFRGNRSGATATSRTSKSNGQDFCFVFGGTGSKDGVPKEEEEANMLTEMNGDCGEQVY